MSHAEIWDDSALIASWNDALDEYNKYHSIHARGGSLEDLEAEVAAQAQADDRKTAASTVTKSDNAPNGLMNNESATQEEQHQAHVAVDAMEEPVAAPRATTVLPMEDMLQTVPDEHIRNMLKAWYFAGYYTGLREAQQQQKSGNIN